MSLVIVVVITFMAMPTVRGAHCEPADEAILTSSYTSLPSCSASHVSRALSSNSRCHLHSVIVTLPWPNSTLVQQMTPTHVSVQRCGGGCHGAGLVCSALATQRKEVAVMVGKCGVAVGKCEKECAIVSVVEHTECSCGCQVDKGICEARGLHRFVRELCTCECKNSDDKRSCLEQGRTWEQDSCSCGCAGSSQCPPGWQWEEKSCSCISVVTNRHQGHKFAAERTDPPEEGLVWELVIITGLLSLLAVLLAVVVMLAVRLRLLRLKEKQAGRVVLVPSTLSGHYIPGADPCSDLTKPRPIVNGHHQLLSDSGSEQDGKPGTRSEQLTDSSLCSSEQEKDASTGSCDSLPQVHHGSQPCLQSVGLSRHLAIRPGPEGSGSLRLARQQRRDNHLPDDRQALMPQSSYFNSFAPPRESPYNTVKIVYKNGEKTMELSCQVDPGPKPSSNGLHITENPYSYEM